MPCTRTHNHISAIMQGRSNVRGSARVAGYQEDQGPTDQVAIEEEYAHLKRQYKIMEGDRKTYSDESQMTIRKQRTAIAKLESDNVYLMGELKLAGERKTDTTGQDDRVKELDLELQSYKRKIRQEHEHLEAIDTEIKRVQKQIVEQQKKMGGCNASSQSDIAVTKQIRILENRLDKSLVRFNESLATNRKLRETIDNLRRERAVFDTIYKKLEKEHHEAKRLMAEIIENSNQAYESRDEAQAKLALQKDKVEKEMMTYNTEIKDLTRFLEQDKKLKMFMGVKAQDREPEEGAAVTGKAKKDIEDKEGADSGETVQSYEEAFTKIKETTHIDDIDQLVEKFQAEEQKNFSLFHYINELNNEIEASEEMKNEILSEVEVIKSQGKRADNQRKKALAQLENTLSQAEKEASTHELKYTNTTKILAQMKTGVMRLFDRIGCDKSSLNDMLGNTGISENNIMQYLGIIEQRTNEILQMYNAVTTKEGSTEEPTSLLGKGPLPANSQVVVVAPSTQDFDSGSDDDEDDVIMPMTREELCAKVLSNEGKQPRAPVQRENKKTKANHGRKR